MRARERERENGYARKLKKNVYNFQDTQTTDFDL